jgi:hypothetical protein
VCLTVFVCVALCERERKRQADRERLFKQIGMFDHLLQSNYVDFVILQAMQNNVFSIANVP